MMTSFECLAKADELDKLGYECLSQFGRESFASLGKQWRRSAIFARQHEAWTEAQLPAARRA